MEPKHLQTYLLMLSAGLLVGSLVTHVIFYQQYQKMDDTMRSQIQTLNISLNRANDNINSIAARLEQQDNMYNGVNNMVYTLELNVNSLETSTEYISHRLDLFEEKYEQLSQENEDNIQQIKDVEEHVEKLYRELGVTEGYKLYLDHEILFQYPKEMVLTEKGLRARDATTLQGLISGSIDSEGYRQIFVTDWEYDILDYYKNNLLTELDNVQATFEDVENLQIGEVKTMTHLGHTLYYRDYSGAVDNTSISGRYGVWFCEAKKRAHMIVLLEYGEEGPMSFNTILESYRCHK